MMHGQPSIKITIAISTAYLHLISLRHLKLFYIVITRDVRPTLILLFGLLIGLLIYLFP